MNRSASSSFGNLRSVDDSLFREADSLFSIGNDEDCLALGNSNAQTSPSGIPIAAMLAEVMEEELPQNIDEIFVDDDDDALSAPVSASSSKVARDHRNYSALNSQQLLQRAPIPQLQQVRIV